MPIPRHTFKILALCVALCAGGSLLADPVTVYDDRAGFEAATGATSLLIPAAEELAPAFGLPGWGCAEFLTMDFDTNRLTVTAPASLPDFSLPGIEHPVCVANAGVPDMHIVPLSNTILGNGEDDFELVFDNPVHALGLELLTNQWAVEEVYFRDELGQTFFAISVAPLTPLSSIEFVGFTSATPIGSVFVDTLNGALENEGISAILVSEAFDGDGDGVLPPADCDDTDMWSFPGAAEVFDGVDNDCDGAVDEGLDADGDGVPDFNDACPGTAAGSGVGPDGCPACDFGNDADGDGFRDFQDCNDADPTVNPGAAEVCNGRDDDCDLEIDEGFDADRDGYTTCGGDCDDADAEMNPGADDLPGNTEDENCDGVLVCDPCAEWDSQAEFVECVMDAIALLGDPIRNAEMIAELANSRVGKEGFVPAECPGAEPPKVKKEKRKKEKVKKEKKHKKYKGKRDRDDDDDDDDDE